ncbi:MAG: hypothetical protein PHW74_03070 [Desulfobacca sp.]|nr:hypothetical protein [Desulfobacca sp.]
MLEIKIIIDQFRYDNLNNIIESVASDTDIDTLDFFGMITNTAIAKINVTFNQPPFGWGLDNLYYGNLTATPVPGAVWLMGSGLMSLIGWRRFRMR